MSLRPHGEPTAKVALDPELISVHTIEGSMHDLADMAELADARVSILIEFYGAENYGHRIGDGAFSLFLIQELFGFISRDTQFIAYRSCLNNCLANRFCAGVLHERRWEWCENDLPILLASMSDRPLQFLESKLPLSFPQSAPLCFENLLMGVGQFTQRRLPAYGTHLAWRAFRDFVIAGLSRTLEFDRDKPVATPARRSMVLLDRTGLSRFNWLNAEVCAATLREEFGSWDIHVMDLRQRSSLAYMLIIHRSHVLVTPGGGFSFASVFLPDSACAIYIDSWHDQQKPPKSTRHHKVEFFDALGYFRATFYRRFAHEPGEVQSRKANFTVNSKRLLAHVDVCVTHVLSHT